MQVATPSIISAFGEKLKIKKILFMYAFPLTFKNWEESLRNWHFFVTRRISVLGIYFGNHCSWG